ncbi:kinase-like domain-containing protein [Rhizophagus clarus]|uniref:Kinase-like domain-containing protein n=1 Tax=Rhizophagus clarus TaxID=94130 RepID=A0A8H3QBX3_9GLOM|nr:kinase-like domain-containing protein [Rhizophagus clarus]
MYRNEDADSGHKIAKDNLALLYKTGEGIKRYYGKASQLYRELYNEGCSNALDIVLECYDPDDDVKFEIKEFTEKQASKVVNTLINGMSDSAQLEFNETIAELGKELVKKRR